jgi:hypothetical protein
MAGISMIRWELPDNHRQGDDDANPALGDYTVVVSI